MSSSHPKPHAERLEARISSEKKIFLKYAADLSGRSLTDFVINSAYEAATRVIQEHELIRLTLEDREVFIQALVSPPKPAKSLLKANKKYLHDVIAK